MLRRSWLWIAAALSAGCASVPPRPPAPVVRVARPAPKPAKVAVAPPVAVEPPPPSAPQPFALPDVAPPVAASAAPGDGHWRAWDKAGADARGPLLLRATLHPDEKRPRVTVTIVAVDLARVGLGMVAGRSEPANPRIKVASRSGKIPVERQDALIAAFNGGFKVKDGRHGMMVDGVVYAPPVAGSCTVAVAKDGGVRVAPWERIAQGDTAAYRQTPPCLIDAGTLHPFLDGKHIHDWGAPFGGKAHVRRSGVGIDASGHVLFYALGEDVTPRQLAESLKRAGAVTAAELDINFSFTWFALYARTHPGAPPEAVETLVPKLVHRKLTGTGEPAYRDFFYLYRR